MKFLITLNDKLKYSVLIFKFKIGTEMKYLDLLARVNT
jgi:hypothetical protein